MPLDNYPLLRKAIAEGRVPNPNAQPMKREPRCGPWAEGRCQRCGRLDPLDPLDELCE